MKRVLLVGPAVHPFQSGLEKLVRTPWQFVPVGATMDDPSLVREIGTADAAITVSYTRAAPPAPRLRLMQVPGAGYDGIDLKALPRGTTLCNCFEHEPGVSEYAMLAMLEWSVRLGHADADMRRGDWSRSSRFGGAPDGELAGRTVAIVGLGRIGRAVARRAKAFEMRVVAANRTVRPDEPNVDAFYGLDRIDDALRQADFVVLGCALTDETRGLIGARALAAMKPGAVIVNVARGPVIDEAALFEALSKRRIGGAVIDTWWRYPAGPADDLSAWPHRFDKLDNVILSAHIAGWTTGTVERRTQVMAANLDRLARGEALANILVSGEPT
ncbi:MAG: phosphoglycerate dehydrogenase [Alphaproteobacteria bacterium]|nr:phosphoglycerate dehydrogenase [Alphaproteobacteria bacterium]